MNFHRNLSISQLVEKQHLAPASLDFIYLFNDAHLLEADQ